MFLFEGGSFSAAADEVHRLIIFVLKPSYLKILGVRFMHGLGVTRSLKMLTFLIIAVTYYQAKKYNRRIGKSQCTYDPQTK